MAAPPASTLVVQGTLADSRAQWRHCGCRWVGRGSDGALDATVVDCLCCVCMRVELILPAIGLYRASTAVVILQAA